MYQENAYLTFLLINTIKFWILTLQHENKMVPQMYLLRFGQNQISNDLRLGDYH